MIAVVAFLAVLKATPGLAGSLTIPNPGAHTRFVLRLLDLDVNAGKGERIGVL
jgi:hypothetical protein